MNGVYLPDGCMGAGLSEADAKALADEVSTKGYWVGPTKFPPASATLKAYRDYAKCHAECTAKADADRAAKRAEAEKAAADYAASKSEQEGEGK